MKEYFFQELSMNQTIVYDLPTRVFHWLFALLFTVAFVIGNTVDDDSTLFSYHMIAGIVLCFLVVLRIIWGIVGTKYARFTGFSLHPRELALYLKGLLTGDNRKWAGHNPASSWAAIAMMAFALGLAVTGYLMATGQGGEDLEELHELLANGFLIIVLLHLTGIALHTVRHRDAVWKSMFSGRKTDISEENLSVRSYRTMGILFLLVTVGFSAYLARNFDGRTRDLTVFGSSFHLGEAEDGEHEKETGEGRNESRRKHVGHNNED